MQKILTINSRAVNSGKALCTNIKMLVTVVDPTKSRYRPIEGMVIVEDSFGNQFHVNPFFLEDV